MYLTVMTSFNIFRYRRFKRRSHKYFAENEEWRRDWPKHEEEKKEPESRPEVPLELTVEKQPRAREPSPRTSPRLSPKAEQKPSSPGPGGRQSSFVDVGTEELPKPSPCVGRADVPPSNLILPPPPPMWYPPLYNPQFGVDPLNFFIDLRVSGHIYDRKRALAEGVDTNISQDRPEESGLDKRLGRDFGMKPRHVSAFSVPVRPANPEVTAKYFDHSSGRAPCGKPNGSSYIMKNLKSVYDNLKTNQDVKVSKVDKEDDPKAESSDLDDDIMD